MIPKKIHYCWFGGNPLPLSVKKCIASWEKYCPDYEIIRWDETNFDVSCHPFIKSAYDEKMWAFVSDYARLKIIYENGGIYLDTDVEILKNIDFLLADKSFIGVQQCQSLVTTGLGFGAEKGNATVLKMMRQYDGLIFEKEKVADFACPFLNDRVVKEEGYALSEDTVRLDCGLTVYPKRFFDPLPPGDGYENLLCNDTVSIHHYSASWKDSKTRTKRMIISFIGEDKVMVLRKLIKKFIGKGNAEK